MCLLVHRTPVSRARSSLARSEPVLSVLDGRVSAAGFVDHLGVLGHGRLNLLLGPSSVVGCEREVVGGLPDLPGEVGDEPFCQVDQRGPRVIRPVLRGWSPSASPP